MKTQIPNSNLSSALCRKGSCGGQGQDLVCAHAHPDLIERPQGTHEAPLLTLWVCGPVSGRGKAAASELGSTRSSMPSKLREGQVHTGRFWVLWRGVSPRGSALGKRSLALSCLREASSLSSWKNELSRTIYSACHNFMKSLITAKSFIRRGSSKHLYQRRETEVAL